MTLLSSKGLLRKIPYSKRTWYWVKIHKRNLLAFGGVDELWTECGSTGWKPPCCEVGFVEVKANVIVYTPNLSYIKLTVKQITGVGYDNATKQSKYWIHTSIRNYDRLETFKEYTILLLGCQELMWWRRIRSLF